MGWGSLVYRSRYSNSLRGWMVRWSNSGGTEIFRTNADRPWGTLSLLYNGYQVSFQGIKRPGRGFGPHPNIAARRKSGVIPPLPAFMACWSVSFTFYLLFLWEIPNTNLNVCLYPFSMHVCYIHHLSPTHALNVHELVINDELNVCIVLASISCEKAIYLFYWSRLEGTV